MAARPPRPLSRRQRRRVLRRRLRLAVFFCIALAVIALASLGVRSVREAHFAAAVAPTPAAAPLPLLPYSSAFVRAGSPWSDDDAQRVGRAVSPIVNGDGFPPTSAAIVVDPRSGRVLYEHNAHMTLVPASTIKLIVAAAALHDLGPNHRFETDIVTNGSISGDTVTGDLYLIGGGDPELSSGDLRAAVHELRRNGVGLVDGDVVSDGSLFGPDEVNKTWQADDLEYGWAAPPSAISIDNGAVQFTISPDPAGGLAQIAIDPPGAAGRIVGNVKTAGESDENTLRIDPLPDGSGFGVSGQIPYGAPQKYWRAIARPTEVSATVLRTLAVASGVAVSGETSSGKAPAGSSTALWSHRSRPLAQIVRHMAFDSDNHIAEQLLRAVGAQAAGTGTLEAGVQAERSFLATLDAADPRMVFADGSGLSQANRVSVSALAAALRSMLAGPDAQAQAALWPRVGLEGTVRFRPLAPDVAGRVRGKDGYIEGASGLAGYVETAHHGVVIYAFLVDDWQQGLDVIWNGEDEILARLARM